MSLNSMIRHLPGSPQAVLLIAYVVSLAQWVTGRRVRCGPGNLYARPLEWPPMSDCADLGGTIPPRPPLITGGLPAPPYPPGPPTGGSGPPTGGSGPPTGGSGPPSGGSGPWAVLFDMDGLLIDSEPLWLASERSVMARLAPGSAWTESDQAALLGGSLNRTVRYLLAHATRPVPPEVVAEWLMAGISDQVRRDGVPLRPGARELLASVEAAGLPRALVTSSERRFMETVLARTGMRFDVLVCADDVSATKPDPEPYLLAAKLLDVNPARCFALEDSPNGVASARAAGCRVIAVPSLIPIQAAPGLTVVRSLAELAAGPDGLVVSTDSAGVLGG
jgi:HAD superfamily hydrolase (TIGR01509 family)